LNTSRLNWSAAPVIDRDALRAELLKKWTRLWDKDYHAQKQTADDCIALILTAMSTNAHTPSDWEKDAILHAIEDSFSGRYGMAMAALELSLETRVAPHPWAAGRPPYLDKFNLAALEKAARHVRARPARRYPAFRWASENTS
jgi:hypothetical protein